jgi:hypothetical protein
MSVLVVMALVSGVTMVAMHVVDVVAVLDLHVPTALAVGVRVLLGLHVLIESALVVVAFMGMMYQAVVQVVDVVAVPHAGVPARVAVLVIVVGERLMSGCDGHGYPLPSMRARLSSSLSGACRAAHRYSSDVGCRALRYPP